MTRGRWLRLLLLLPFLAPFVAAWAMLRCARFTINVPLALASGGIEWVLHGEWYWPGWRAMWGWR